MAPDSPSSPAPPAADRDPSALAAPEARKARPRPGDRIFSGLARGSGLTLLLIMASIAVFLSVQAVVALQANHGNFLTTFQWNVNAKPPVFGIAVLAYGTIVTSLIALVLAVPVSVGIALFISHYAPRRIASPIAYVIDLLAAVPSVVYGLWGFLFLVPHLEGLYEWLDDYFAWTRIFEYSGGAPRTLFAAAILLAVMIVPIVTNVSREVFRQSPKMQEEAALALGATRWEVVRTAVLPFGRSGVISAAMLGLGRALGETMAVALVLSPSFDIRPSLLNPGGGTFAQNIAASFEEASPAGVGREALIASGLVLFLITLLVNGLARMIIARRKEYSGATA
ncbi:phosphate ABC transporter permease subunit PstC [Streptomyces sp. TR06-5]|uniref:phosphate ABC transporter permease subunit PstC n=1 Tax=unclassified Streptomyces TaxID=2593676 RepID=UPI0039A00E84